MYRDNELGPTYSAVRGILYIKMKKYHPNRAILKNCINNVITEDIPIGSWRGYYAFQHHNYKKRIAELYRVFMRMNS